MLLSLLLVVVLSVRFIIVDGEKVSSVFLFPLPFLAITFLSSYYLSVSATIVLFCGLFYGTLGIPDCGSEWYDV